MSKEGYKGYWPNAIAYQDGNKEPVRLFSYGPADSLEQAKNVIKAWGDDHYNYDILVSWITHSWDNKKVCFNVNEELMRKLEFGGYFKEDVERNDFLTKRFGIPMERDEDQ